MNKLYKKLKRLQDHCSTWNKQIFGNIFQNTSLAIKEVDTAKKLFFEDPSSPNLINMNRANIVLIIALNVEDTYWKQKCSIKWLKDGERNTKFFHNFVKGRRTRNLIHSISDSDLVVVGDDLVSSGCNFFQNLLQNQHPTTTGNPSLIDDAILLQRTDNTQQPLIPRPSMDQIFLAISSLNPSSSGGSDGFNAKFYQSWWNIIKEDICAVVWDFWDDNPIPPQILHTLIIPIPKIQHP